MVGDAVLGAPDALGLEEAVAEHLGEDVVVVALGAELGVGEFSRRHGRTGGDECRIGLGRGCGSGSGSRGPRMSAAALRGEDSGEVGTDVVALDLLESVKESGCPGQAGDGVVGFVAAEAEDG